MDFLMSQSLPYTNAPTTPNAMQYCLRAPTSPTSTNEQMKTSDDDDVDDLNSFEFETSKKFGVYVQFEDTTNYCFQQVDDDDDDEEEENRQGMTKRRHERGGSLPTMAFADELFFNGQVMPLKLPPRLNQPPTSPISFKVPLVLHHDRPTSWNDDFDPFMVALQVVREEHRRRTSINDAKLHRRSKSLSSFRVMPLEDEFVEEEETNKKDCDDEKVVDSDDKKKGIKGILIRRCATFWKENGEEEKSTRKWKTSNYLKKLGSKFKGNLTLPLCFYGIESPRII